MTQREKELTEQVERLTKLVNALVQELAEAKAEILVHDSLASYWQYGSGHGLCCAHILRELNGVAETHPEQTWVPSFIKLLLDMKRAKDEAVSNRREWLDAKTRNEFSRRYGQILRRAYQENPPPSEIIKHRGRRKRGRVLALIDRLKKTQGINMPVHRDVRRPV